MLKFKRMTFYSEKFNLNMVFVGKLHIIVHFTQLRTQTILN